MDLLYMQMKYDFLLNLINLFFRYIVKGQKISFNGCNHTEILYSYLLLKLDLTRNN